MEAAALLLAEGLVASGPSVLRIGPRGLRGVPDNRPRGVAPATADHPPLHGGQVLCLVDQDVRVLIRLPDPAGEQSLTRVLRDDLGAGLRVAETGCTSVTPYWLRSSSSSIS